MIDSNLFQNVHKRLGPLGHKTSFQVALILVLGVITVLFLQSDIPMSPLAKSLKKRTDRNKPPRPYHMVTDAFLSNSNNEDTVLLDLLPNCTLSYEPPPPRSEWTTKPIFLSGYPSSTGGDGPADLVKPLVTMLTGLNRGAKNYHAAKKGLKRCKSSDETVTCSQVHPIVGISPQRFTAQFSPNVVVAIRNIKTAFPRADSFKRNKYYHEKGQMPEERWRKTGHEWMEKAFEDWKSVIVAWKELNYYNVSFYLPYEHLMDPEKGPGVVQRFARHLESLGFPAALPAEDAACMWRKVIQKHLEFEKSYTEYEPGFTEPERDFMVKKLEEMMEESSEDAELVAILQEYHTDFRYYTRIYDE